ncbi:unnamed protein product, partial [Leptidea sinapis]
RLAKRNGIKEEDSNWYWDPPQQSTRPIDSGTAEKYETLSVELQNELSTLDHDHDGPKPSKHEEELNRLREENKNLTNNLEDLDNQHQLAMEKLLNLKRELQKNFELLKQEHEELKNANDDYAAQVNHLQTKLSERDKEIESIKSSHADYETLHRKYQHLEKIHSLLRENAEKFQEENQELHEEVFKLQEQVTKLEHDVEIALKQCDNLDMVSKAKYEEVLNRLNDLARVHNTDQFQLDEINIDDNAKSVIETLKRDISDLRHQLSQSKSEDLIDSKVVKSDKIMQLYNRYVNFDLPIDYVGEIPSSTDNIVLFKLESVFKTVNSFKKKIDVLEQKVLEKKHTINHLKSQIEELSAENEYLTSDIQHYEQDLDEMKKNNDFLISEIAALKNTSKLEPIIETHEDNLVELESELADCNHMNKTFEVEIKRVESELNEVKSEKTILQESLNDLRKKYTSMLDELDSFKLQTKSVEELESSANATCQNQQFNKSRDVVADLKKRLSVANSKNEQLSIDLHIIENDKVLLTKEVDDLKHALSEKSSSHKELESLKIILDQKLKDLEIKLDDLLKHKQEIENENLRLEQQVKNFTVEITSQVNHEDILNENAELARNLNVLQTENFAYLENINELNNEIIKLQEEQNNLVIANDTLKETIEKETQKYAALESKMQAFKSKSDKFDELYHNQTVLKEENKHLLEQSLILEAELTSTNRKIVSLEEEFEKLMIELNDKDVLIASLNASVSQYKSHINELEENISELNKVMIVKSDEVNALRLNLQEVTEKLNKLNASCSLSHDELKRLHTENEETSKQIFALNDEINTKNSEISILSEKLRSLHSEHQLQLDEKENFIKNLQQSIKEITDTAKNNTQQNDEIVKIIEEKEMTEKKIIELTNNLSLLEYQLTEYKNKCETFNNKRKEYEVLIEQCNNEKNNLINLVNLKHNESLQYHAEIQRLNQIVIEQADELRKTNEHKDVLQKNDHETCLNCTNLLLSIKDKDETIMSLNQNTSTLEHLKVELNIANETIQSLTKKCEDLDKHMSLHLESVKKLTAENAQLSEKERNSSKELERLREHLVETEDNYTQELMTCEQKLTECQSRLIRANQEVETLRNQIKLLEKQREDVQTRLSDAEDSRNRSEAALINLQVVLEQFQLDKERDVDAATEKIKNKMAEIKRENLRLQDEIAHLNAKLEESVAGLKAASRLGDQVESKTAQINDLKEQVRTLQVSVAASEDRYYNAISNQQDKVDKNLVKNLVINYDANSPDPLNCKECEKLGLVKAATAADGLAAEFVKFLQNESKPRPPPPDMMSLRRPNPVFEVSHKRNPSTGSSNLLFQNIDADTSSQKSMDSDTKVIPITTLDTGVNQTRNNEGAILKHVLKDM